MPQRRALRLGTTAAMSISALTLLLVTAGPAEADTCPPGTDLDSTLKNWECQWNNLIKPSPTPTAPPVKKPVKKPVAKKPVAKKPAKKPANGGTGRKNPSRPVTTTSGGGGAVDARTPVTAYSNGERVNPYGSAGDLPGALPRPDVAAAPLPDGPQPGSAAVLHTRLMAPMAAAENRQNTQLLWVAAASGLAGAAGALNISIVGRRLREGRR